MAVLGAMEVAANGDLATQTAALAQDINAIRLLVGAEFDRALLPTGIDEVNSSLGEVPAGLSTQVLLRRPDVVQAEYQLRAANADIGVARAQLFPTISTRPRVRRRWVRTGVGRYSTRAAARPMSR